MPSTHCSFANPDYIEPIVRIICESKLVGPNLVLSTSHSAIYTDFDEQCLLSTPRCQHTQDRANDTPPLCRQFQQLHNAYINEANDPVCLGYGEPETLTAHVAAVVGWIRHDYHEMRGC